MRRLLPEWLERIVLPGQSAAGEGTAWSLDHTWPIAAWASALIVSAAVAWVVYCYRGDARHVGRSRSALLAAMRLSLLAIVLWMIAGFVLKLERTGLPSVVIVVDDSKSMGIADRLEDGALEKAIGQRVQAAGYADPTRLNQAKTLLTERGEAVLKAIERRHRLRLVSLAAGIQAESGFVADLAQQTRALEPIGEATRLGRAVRGALEGLSGSPPAAIILMTDGVNTDGESLADAAEFARQRGVPIFAIGLGSERPARDLEIADLLFDEVAFAGDVATFEFRLTGIGFEGRSVMIRLRDQSSQETLASLSAVVGPDGQPQTLRLAYRPPEAAELHFAVEVEEVPEETRLNNNRQQGMLSVRKDRIRVLTAHSSPNFEYRYLKNLLQRDARFELHSVLQEADPEHALEDSTALSTFPAGRDELFQYDVIVLGDINLSLLAADVQRNLADFVSERGGGLVVIAGPAFGPLAYRDSPLEFLLPVAIRPGTRSEEPAETEEYKPRLTELGASDPALQLGDSPEDNQPVWESLPSLNWLYEVDEVKAGARVLAVHPTRVSPAGQQLPILVSQYVGRGKVVFHATDETWRWRYMIGDKYFARYWMQTLRSLGRGRLADQDRLAELSVDRREYRLGESARLRLRYVDERRAPAEDHTSVTIERAGTRNRAVTLARVASHRGIFEGQFAPIVDGDHHAWLSSPAVEGRPPAVDFTVAAAPGELQVTRMDAAGLKKAADVSGGKYYTWSTSGRLVADLPAGRAVPVESLPPIALWNRWPVVATFLSLLVGEWVLRRRWGLS